MTDGPREELRALLFDSAPPAPVDGDAMFARTLASGDGAGADLLPPDGLFDLPADDPDGFDPGSDDGFAADANLPDDGYADVDDVAADGAPDTTWDDHAVDPDDAAGPDAADPGDPAADPAAIDPATGW